MGSNYGPWNGGSMTGNVHNINFDMTGHDHPCHPDQAQRNGVLPTHLDSASLANGPRDVGLPPSLQAAVANPPPFIYNHQTWLDVPGANAFWDDGAVEVTATNPLSFAQRSLQSAQWRPAGDVDLLNMDSMTDLYSDPRRDSGIGSSEGVQEQFESEVPLSHSSEDTRLWHGTDCGCQTSPSLDQPTDSFHKELRNSEIPGTSSTRGSVSAPTVPCSRGDKQSLPCPLCPDKFFTGPYAQRNLNRHMQVEHSPSSSLDGHSVLRCGKQSCPRTFRRPDARLVHERRSHPELNRAPATRRKRSGEI